jgi:signal transduction histidine kinase
VTHLAADNDMPILIVDDDPILRALMRAAIENDGFLVEEAIDAEEAYRLCEELTPKLIIVDVVMPGMNGFDLCRALRLQPKTMHVPILMATGLDDVASIQQAFDAGASDFISKPLNWVILCHRIRYLLRASLAFDEARRARRAVEESAAAVLAANELLEHRVEERTQELREIQSELLKQERFSTIGQVTATMAHELRNPLGAISNTIFVVRAASGASPVLGRAVDRMERSIARCNKIIEGLLDYTHARDLKWEHVAIDSWLGSVLDDAALPAGIALERSFGASGVTLNIATDGLRRVIVNLVENSVQALEDRAEAEVRRICVTTRFADGVHLTVEDTGPGIVPDILPQIFEPLFSTRSFGTGLGLAIARQVVEQHNGTIEVTSEVGRGTSVHVHLPHVVAKTIAA